MKRRRKDEERRGARDIPRLRPHSVAELRAIVLGGNEAVIPNIVAPSVDVHKPSCSDGTVGSPGDSQGSLQQRNVVLCD